jgi:hypothetical protein
MNGTLSKYIIEQARHGELDQVRLRDGALLYLAKSNLKYPPTAAARPQLVFCAGASTKRPLTV